MIDRVRQSVHDQSLLRPGDRLAVAVSGGADSVALLRVLAELKQELGIVLSTAHFHHGIRGAEADADQQFVADLSEHLGLELHLGRGESPAHAREHGLSLETAARELRHLWFAELITAGKADKIATAHTLDDQAETVLMRLLRGAANRGLAGIFPSQKEKHLVRPLLAITRREIENYLKNLGQPWREDSSNRNLSHTRNRIRHQLLPQLEKDFNPATRRSLADLAEVARAESEYWDTASADVLERILRAGKPSRSGRRASGEASRTFALDLRLLAELPLALERHVLYRAAERLGIKLEFSHIRQLAALARQTRAGKRLVLPGGLTAVRTFRELQLTPGNEVEDFGSDYHYSLRFPGQVTVPELQSVFHARMVEDSPLPGSTFGVARLLNPTLLAPELIVRNWHAGDRFFPAMTRQPRKVKELLQAGRLGRQLSPAERKCWPVVESAGQIVWVRGFAVPEAFAARSGKGLLIEESTFGSVSGRISQFGPAAEDFPAA